MKSASIADLTVRVSERRDHIHGAAAASVTLLKYGDLECVTRPGFSWRRA